MKTKKIKLQVLCVGILIGLLSISCNGSKDANKTDEASEYDVLTVSPKTIELYREFPVTIEGIENIEIYPKIEGFIEKVLVDEGEYVEKGRALFLLNAPEYEQNVLSTKAAISSAVANVSSAELDVEKARPLVEREIVSKFELTAAENTLTAQKAALEQARADYVNARTNYGYTKITAPVSGYIGTLPYKLGSLVSSTTDDPLTTVSNIKKVYAYFSINEKIHLEFMREGHGATPKEQLDSMSEVSLILPDYTMFNHKGRIQTVSGQVDEDTGSFNVRAIFDNPDNLLRTGNSATIRIPRTVKDALLVPQSATYEIQGSVFIYVVGDDSKVKAKKIEVTPSTSGKAYIVTAGLETNDQVVIEGINTLLDGKEIKPVQVKASDIEDLKIDSETIASSN
ncbi:efflux RND transporter periplasmic adaptor subunit [Cellulophaga baltica]|uniref:efflux RND transporter periplasmic adaptor subunit n=1 Tax=Cellulophaga TaxID=104264 RepID=UPI001C0670E1|nr:MULTISPECIES: efflux RND transporter periplasmic adaptor subunit [Cellulophaga]MBU2997252.1 efflux RND transporter periplasmic adaptor subunit [Cellulophaga baltica]MDO6768650.1 efflux RND transporter periplasmic adaptor subunit [Cellulophaga sp. 1_MG-2023]